MEYTLVGLKFKSMQIGWCFLVGFESTEPMNLPELELFTCVCVVLLRFTMVKAV